ncbi:hypothetical protein L3X38_024247 [Prunus dulcis]|uniref:Uncharacterized protein n=1 Tax=Prunus dulcis TaxID=3755 RepID=A0AAD4W124_PRUDU|nr:hypothetical protein L3X38_024247 [Prunus dulcis]
MAAGGGRSAAAKFGRHSGENRRFPAAGAAADLGGGLGRDAEAEPVSLASEATKQYGPSQACPVQPKLEPPIQAETKSRPSFNLPRVDMHIYCFVKGSSA